VVARRQEGSALGEGFYWMAGKLMWGYEGVERDPPEAYRLYRQAAELGSSDAYVRLGQLEEHGKGTDQNPLAAIKSYQEAVRAGNFFGLAYLAKLLSRSSHKEKAEELWTRFFKALEGQPEPGFACATRGEVLHDYIVLQLRLGLEPNHMAILTAYRFEIIGHHQQVLEHVTDEMLDRLDAVSDWIALHWGRREGSPRSQL
jgi:TPR repeat protein